MFRKTEEPARFYSVLGTKSKIKDPLRMTQESVQNTPTKLANCTFYQMGSIHHH